ncbi:hypothetical protein AVEN_185339-1 [Araneus ventricosus]|uniref:Uncharacterized protein n=1 Tax=Araneus ventricosus TaxID=182803 RepID=A0A4Y2PTF0_ARAVE|nr:hypothetical protein AVEN_185339-1 [Araneus ventricosus]
MQQAVRTTKKFGNRWHRKLKQSEPIFLNDAGFQNPMDCQVTDVRFRVGQHCDQQIFKMGKVTVSLNYGTYFGFQFCVQLRSDEFEQVPYSIFTVRANFDSKPEFSKGESIETYNSISTS